MDLKTIKAANRVREFQEGVSSPIMKDRIARLAELNDEEKKKLMADAFGRALSVAEVLVTQPEYDADSHTLDFTNHSLGRINLVVYHDEGEEPKGDYEGLKPFDGISVNPNGAYDRHLIVSELHDTVIYLNRDGTIPEGGLEIEGLDQLVLTTLEYEETLAGIQKVLLAARLGLAVIQG